MTITLLPPQFTGRDILAFARSLPALYLRLRYDSRGDASTRCVLEACRTLPRARKVIDGIFKSTRSRRAISSAKRVQWPTSSRKTPKKLYVLWNVTVRRAAVRSRVWLSLYLNSCRYYFAQPIKTANTATVSATPCAKIAVQRLRPDSRKTPPSTKPEYVLSSTPDGPL